MQLAADITRTQKGDRVVLATLTLDSSQPLIADILKSLEEAAVRGVNVTLLVDAYTFLTSKHKVPGPLWYLPTLSQPFLPPFLRHYKALRRLEASGVKTVVTNIPKAPFLPIPAGRSHIKAAVINDKIYVGGCNLTSPNQLDLMVSWHDAKHADWLYDQLASMVQHQGSQGAFGGIDQRLQCSDGSELIIDAGKRRQSAILETAYSLIDNAKKNIVMTCQYFPGGATAQHLLAAHKRGVHVQIFYSHPSVHGIEAPAHHLHILRERARLPKELFENELPKGSRRLHAKVLVSEQSALIGSHNYVTQGVRLGTAELALFSKDSTFATALRDKTIHLLSTNTDK